MGVISKLPGIKGNLVGLGSRTFGRGPGRILGCPERRFRRRPRRRCRRRFGRRCRRLRCRLALWQELGAIDIVLEEVAREFDGEDPLRPIMRGIVETTRKKLTDLHEVLSAVQPLELSEPGEEALDLVRTYFESGKRLMSSL